MMTDTTPAVSRGSSAPRAAAIERVQREDELCALVTAIAHNDQVALSRLYDAMHRVVYSVAHRILGERDLAEEVLLDVFLQVWRRAATFEVRRGQVSTWLVMIARSRALDRRRSLAARTRCEYGWNDALDRSTVDSANCVDPAEAYELRERCCSIRSAIHGLPELQRRALELTLYAGLSHTEIADRLGEPLGTIKTRIRLGMLRLREALKGMEELS